MSVTGKVWSESVQKGIASSCWRSLSTSLCGNGENAFSPSQALRRYLARDHTDTNESSLPDTKDALSGV